MMKHFVSSVLATIKQNYGRSEMATLKECQAKWDNMEAPVDEECEECECDPCECDYEDFEIPDYDESDFEDKDCYDI